MGRTTRKIRKNKRKQAEEDLSQKVGMFDKLPDECTSCQGPFDKKDREMVSSWYVIVKEEEGRVNLYCPPCWETAQRVLEDFRNKLEERGDS